MRLLLIALLLVTCHLHGAALSDKAAAIDELMNRYHEYRQFNGPVLVAEGGEVVYRKGLGLANMEWSIPNTSDTKFRLGSITKQFTAALILLLAPEGKLDIDGTVSQYVPEYPAATGDRVTVHQLLTHTSGIKSFTSMPKVWDDLTRDPFKPLDFIKVFANEKVDFEPGKKFQYNNSGYFLLGVIIEKVTGQSYEEALQERIFDPLGMSDSGYDRHEKLILKRAGGYSATLDGYIHDRYIDMSTPYAAGALYSTVEDLHVWDEALYGGKLLSAEDTKRMFTPHVEAPNPERKMSYGYGWFIETAKRPDQPEEELTVIGHGGGIPGFNTIIQRIPSERHLIVLFNNTGGTKLGEMAEKIRHVLYDVEPEAPRLPVSHAVYETYKQGGVEAAVGRFHDLKKSDPEAYDFSAAELHRVGRHLLEEDRHEDAVAIFKLSTEEHPKDAGGHLMLGDAYRRIGKKEDAARSYAQALELRPERPEVVLRRLEQLEKGEE